MTDSEPSADLRVEFNQQVIESFCRKWRISELAVFGSALREDFGSGSDVDVLVSFSRGARHGFFDLARMQDELAHALGREVDLVSRHAVEASRNHLRRDAILDNARVIYAAG